MSYSRQSIHTHVRRLPHTHVCVPACVYVCDGVCKRIFVNVSACFYQTVGLFLRDQPRLIRYLCYRVKQYYTICVYVCLLQYNNTVYAHCSRAHNERAYTPSHT